MQPYQHNKQSGFTLMEAMIALVIFSIGLLGLAGLQSVGIRNNQTGYLRTIAMQQAYNMADYMRINLPGALANNYTGLGVGDAPGTAPPQTNCVGAAANCTIATIATADFFEWQTANQAALPNGHGTISAGVVAGVFSIRVMYDEAGNGVNGTGCLADQTVDLKCYTLDIEL